MDHRCPSAMVRVVVRDDVVMYVRAVPKGCVKCIGGMTAAWMELAALSSGNRKHGLFDGRKEERLEGVERRAGSME